MGLRLAVGTTNPAKLEAVERALEEYEPSTLTAPVDSGVAEQPRSTAETITGAKTRARRALEATEDADLGVGLEGGVTTLDSAPGLYLIMWAAVTDGDRTEVGSGPSVRLPAVVATRVEAGEELGPVIDELVGTVDVAEKEGAIGVLTGGGTDRTRALGEAIACAVGPFLTDHYDQFREVAGRG